MSLLRSSVTAAAAVLLLLLCVLSLADAVAWNVDAPCFMKKSGIDSVAVKDPSIVFVNGRYHLFYTAKDSCCFRMGYATATTIPGLLNAQHVPMDALKGGDWVCAPQVFWFAAKNTWYLIYQNDGCTFSTNSDITNPNGWTPGKSTGIRDGGIDFWVISDGAGTVYMFYSPQKNSEIWTRHTSVANFPYGWSSSSVAISTAFEGVHVYHNLADKKYYMMVEVVYRWFQLHVATSLAGPWTMVEDRWAFGSNLIFNPGVQSWTGQVSHGEIIRASNNEFMEIRDIDAVDVLIQGTDASAAYGDLPYELGLIHNYGFPKATCMMKNEGTSVILSCDSGQIIDQITFASFGTPNGDCNTGFTTSSCNAANSLSIVQAKCAGKPSCQVTGDNSVFGDPCSGTQKRLAVQVTCKAGGTPPPPSNKMCAVTTNEGAAATVSCDPGQIINSIDFASYGTPTGDCSTSLSKSSCDANTSVSVMQAKCVALPNCTVVGGNDVFGDPCSGIGKHLAVQVSCVAASSADKLCAVANEGSAATVGCAAGKKITKIDFASYGQPQGSCTTSWATATCHASTSQSVVAAACLNKNTCSVLADNNSFGDPCATIGKQLAIAVTCG